MSHRTRLARLEKICLGGRVWALIGIGKPENAQHQNILEKQARQAFYDSGGNKEAYIAFLPFDTFKGFLGYVKKNELFAMIMNKNKNPADNRECSWDSQVDGTSSLELH